MKNNPRIRHEMDDVLYENERAASATEMTGLISAQPYDVDTVENLRELLPLHRQKPANPE